MNKSFLSGTRWRALGLSAWRALTHFVKHGGQHPVTRHVHRWSARFLRSLWYGTALVLAVVALLFSVARVWLLPALAERNQEIAEYVSEQSGYPVRIGSLESYWDGLNPGLRVFDFTVAAAARERPAVQLKELRLSLSWWALLTGRIQINSLLLVEPRLAFERMDDGRFRISGFDPLDLEMPDEHSVFAQWLFEQRELVIENGELLWIDHRRAGASLRLDQVNLSLRNSAERHRLGIRARFPERLCERCAFVADVYGNPLIDDDWTGTLYVETAGLDVEQLPPIIREALPEAFRGRFSVRLWSDWKDNRPRQVNGDVDVADLQIPIAGLDRPLAVREAQTDLRWRGGAETWRLDLNALHLGLTGAPWPAGRLRIEQRPDETVIRIKHIDVGDVARFVGSIEQHNQALDWMRALRPAGALNDFKLTIDSNWFDPAHYLLETEVADLAVAAHRDFPGLRGVGGRLRAHTQGGEFMLDSAGGQVDLRQVFREPLAWDRAEGRIRWQRTDDEWQVFADKLRLRSSDGEAKGDVELRLPHTANAEASPYLKLEFDFRDLQGVHAERYYPAILPGDVRTWLERAIVSGKGNRGRALFDGRIADFPFRNGNGRFEVTAHVTDALFEYLPGWPRIEKGEVDLLFRGAEMLITASSGRIGTLNADRVVVAIDDLGETENQLVRISGRVRGPLNDTLQLLYQTPPDQWRRQLVAGLRADGLGTLALDLRVPLSSKEPLRMRGAYQFQHTDLHTPIAGLSLETMDGHLLLDEHGISAAELTARLLGGPVTLRAASDAHVSGRLRVDAEGRFSGAGVTSVFEGLAGHLEGAADWRASATLTAGVPTFSWESDLRGLGINLPPPFDKPRDAAAATTVRTVTAGADHHVLEATLAPHIKARLAFHQQAQQWAFNKGRISIGGPPPVLPDQAGLYLNLQAARLDGDRWLALYKPGAGGREPGLPGWLTQVNANIGALRVFGRDVGAFGLDLGRWQRGWHGRVSGDALSGSVALPATAATPGTIHLALDYLHLPDTLVSDDATQFDPRDLPALTLKTETLKWYGKQWGTLEFAATPYPSGWRIDQLLLTQADTRVRAHGAWRFNDAGRPVTELDVEVTSDALGKTLSALGYPDEVVGGEFTVTSNWSWPGGPTAFGLEQLTGNMTVAVDKGRLLKVQQGAGRLLGVLNMSALSRYLNLDFSGIFGKGLNFDSIRGALTVESGHAYTSGLHIKGPSANVFITGRVGLGVRDLDLEIGVTPRFGEELAITSGLLGGPAVGAAVALMQGLLKPQIDQRTRVEYRVQGGWDDPTVHKLEKSSTVEPVDEN